VFVGFESELSYNPPWAVPFELRRSWLAGGDLRVAYIYELEDTSTFRYRVFNMVEALRARPDLGISATWFTRTEFHVDQSFVDDSDVIVICRTRYDEGVARLVERAHARGTKVFYDVDDLVFDLSLVHYIMEAIGASTSSEDSWNYWYSYIGRLRATLDLCDGAIATTEPLAERLRSATGGLPCEVIPNTLNRLQTEVSTMLLEQKRASGYQRDEWVTIGFLSGSPSHSRDLQVASPALAAAMQHFPDLRIQMVGFADTNDVLRPYADRIDHAPLQDYLNLQRITASCEFCIVPLSLNMFTRCKSGLKFFEAGAVECPIIATPIPSYAASITDGVDGFLAASHEWREKLEAAYVMTAAGSGLYQEMAEAARGASLDRYGYQTNADRIAEVFGRLLDRKQGVGGGGS
jgi:glycosyltransferase involved in cell wall biosynthesis